MRDMLLPTHIPTLVPGRLQPQSWRRSRYLSNTHTCTCTTTRRKSALRQSWCGLAGTEMAAEKPDQIGQFKYQLIRANVT